MENRANIVGTVSAMFAKKLFYFSYVNASAVARFHSAFDLVSASWTCFAWSFVICLLRRYRLSSRTTDSTCVATIG